MGKCWLKCSRMSLCDPDEDAPNKYDALSAAGVLEGFDEDDEEGKLEESDLAPAPPFCPEHPRPLTRPSALGLLIFMLSALVGFHRRCG